ncbi:hypothetical protein [Paenibacillus maysiensis]|uniref:hypothetical protein n=1 Tax=Paenibacillus maysiensis TaxID=1155954 RepID=UPI0004B0CE1D|nr:hypothetical protein [Paenibacillus maysiensis]
MWYLKVYSAFSYSLAQTGSRHYSIFPVTDFSEHETFYLRSIHADSLPESESTRASYRLKSFLRMLNASLELSASNGSNFSVIQAGELFYSTDDNDWRRAYVEKDLNKELEELMNPFDSKVFDSHEVKFSKRSEGIIELAFFDELVRENILLFSTFNSDPLYTFINCFRVLDTIRYDFSQNLKEEDIDSTKLQDAIKIFTRDDLSHYINTRDGSGFMSRHGVKNGEVFNKAKPTYQEIVLATKNLINEWIDCKLYLYRNTKS